MNAVLEKISKIGIVPVVKIDRVEDALPLAKALCNGGLPCAEVTFRTDAAAGAIKAMTENFPQIVRHQTTDPGISENTKQGKTNKQANKLHLSISFSNCKKTKIKEKS